jgi:hypothetical protein
MKPNRAPVVRPVETACAAATLGRFKCQTEVKIAAYATALTRLNSIAGRAAAAKAQHAGEINKGNSTSHRVEICQNLKFSGYIIMIA